MIGRSLERSTQIAYVLNEFRAIQYANPACADWVGVELESMIDLVCEYNLQRVGNEQKARIAGLCPPPEIFDAQSEKDLIRFAVRKSEGNETVWRSATALRMSDPTGKSFNVLTLVSNTDLDEQPVVDVVMAPEESQQLHQIFADMMAKSAQAYQVENLIGVSQHSVRVQRLVRTAGDSASDMLIVGPAGSGKEHLARTIHQMRLESDLFSDRSSAIGRSSFAAAAGLLTPIDCLAADAQMVQSTISAILSEIKKAGSLNGRRQVRWLLLLNVDRLSVEAQSELFGFLQLPDSSLRCLATSARPLRELDAAEFHQGLAQSLSMMTIELLPLSKRADDIALLAQAFLEKAAVQLGKTLTGFDAASNRLLEECHWPGNLDQLQSVVNEACEAANGTEVTTENLPKRFHDLIRAGRIGAAKENAIDLNEYLQSIERELIVRAIHQSKGNKTKAASLLNISRAKFLRRLQFFQIDLSVEVGSDQTNSDKEPIDSSVFEEID